ncbi:MAG: CBS domain-containing protein [Candidatus Bathyarchaeota archaeon]|nr:CBS domain-containing protein [Candidatus Bathyarchaeota archaeon]
MASNVLVKDIMTKDIHIAKNETSVADVLDTMSKYDLNYMMVIQSEKPTGIITIHDLLVRLFTQNLAPNAVIARMVYTNPLVTIDEEATVDDAIKLMNHWKIKHLPVIDKEGKMLGVLTKDDIIFNIPSKLADLKELCYPQSGTSE